MFRSKRDQYQADGDPLIPILNLVCMLIPLLLYGAVFVKFHTLDVQAPKTLPCEGEHCDPKNTDNLDLTVMLTNQGFYFKVNPKFKKPWMTQDHSVGPDIPKKDDTLDFAELNRKLRELKQEHKTETKIILGAEDDVQYEAIIKTMDHSRGTDTAPLFPNVILTRGVV